MCFLTDKHLLMPAIYTSFIRGYLALHTVKYPARTNTHTTYLQAHITILKRPEAVFKLHRNKRQKQLAQVTFKERFYHQVAEELMHGQMLSRQLTKGRKPGQELKSILTGTTLLCYH